MGSIIIQSNKRVEMEPMTIKKLLHQIFLKRKGGKTSAKIVDLLLIRPYNGSQIARIIEMDYNTIEYHLEILCKSKLVMCESDSYGSLYYPTDLLLKNHEEYEKIKEMDLTAASEEFNFHMDKYTDYYIYLGGVKGC
mgnify:CR=1 FL=1